MTTEEERDHKQPPSAVELGADERVYKVEMLARVEGEGRFWLRLDAAGEVADAKLAIFEAPRFFEAFLRGRDLEEVPDIVARICGICPVAYQMGAVRALERILGVDPPSPGIRSLRRLLYCGEWIESHVLHVFMLHAPDFLGYESAIEMAADHRARVEQGLRLKKVGNAIIEVLGGRAIHPVSPKVGGFSRTPTVAELAALRPRLEAALEEAEAVVEWSAGLPMPALELDYVFVSLASEDYPIEFGDEVLVRGRGRDERVDVDEFLDHFVEDHVAHSNALQCRLRDGTPYLVGPMARLNLFADRLHPRAARALERSGLALPVRNPYQSIIVRAVEVVHAFATALDIVTNYTRRVEPAFVELPPAGARAGRASGGTEAPRGLCWHRYETDAEGLIVDARIVPPTSQNQARIERDLVGLAPQLLAMDHGAATRRCEQLIRAYDPCISCATHFLKLEIERG
ncbi:nickel-dependent hydrogenase, large subunit [Plesiocystis pacifica SIR-1]|uniref:Nickel-dependent hydrogenase, large subunit n=1 Tax=Plesiocystis pacifica SIR-1 TaxID=391625 RepID=A6FYA6_9BACT|nr:nickel-dependent hydrogenase large subunit [Plesiocystis pacifica]EDM81485.1 nickel-dependent hydrogenase, large subunit [Plesiocystis pacifica SIR-1]